MSATNHMNTVHITQHALDAILALQLTVAWAGEGLADPKRLDWWRTDLVDPMGGGDLFARLFPKTHRWASLEAVRKAAIQVDREARLGLAKPDQVRTLFFWGFALDEKLMERLAPHKQSGEVPYRVVPGGRELTGAVPDTPELRAQCLAAALLPLADNYPTPFVRVED